MNNPKTNVDNRNINGVEIVEVQVGDEKLLLTQAEAMELGNKITFAATFPGGQASVHNPLDDIFKAMEDNDWRSDGCTG